MGKHLRLGLRFGQPYKKKSSGGFLDVLSTINRELTIGLGKEAARQIFGRGKKKREKGVAVINGRTYLVNQIKTPRH